MPVREVRGHRWGREQVLGIEYRTDKWNQVQLANDSNYLSKDQKYRGMIYVVENDTIINGNKVREALDTLTIDNPEAVIEIPCHKNAYNRSWSSPFAYRRMFKPYRLRMTTNGRVALTAPCGETRMFSVRTLDRILTYFGC